MATLIRSAVAGRQLLASAGAHAGRRSMSTWHAAPINVDFGESVKQSTVQDTIVNVTFVNYAGERERLPARVGDTLLDVAVRYKYKFLDGACGGGGNPQDVLHPNGNWYEPKYGEGAFCYYCHVIIPKSHYGAMPPKLSDEVEQLQKYPFKEDVTETSRLACQVKVTKDMEGMIVYVPDGPRSDIT